MAAEIVNLAARRAPPPVGAEDDPTEKLLLRIASVPAEFRAEVALHCVASIAGFLVNFEGVSIDEIFDRCTRCVDAMREGDGPGAA